MKPEVIVTPGFDTLQAELKEFAACIRETRPYPISTDQVLHGVQVFEVIAKSARLGAPVVLD
jgi:predicted dehydrogenase